MALQAIVFDMDGVIADTEYLDYQQQTGFVKAQGGTHDENELSRLVGKSYLSLHQTMQELIGGQPPLPIPELRKRFADHVQDFYQRVNYIEYFRKDIIHILDYADKEGIKLAVASSSTREHILQILGQCGIQHRFSAITSGEEMEESKPNPAIYLHTLKVLGVRAKDAVAVEDSPSGIKAAQSAGLPVIAYKEERMKIDQSQADYMGENMQEIFGIIKTLHEG